jgi:hypothetical protein
MRLDNIRNVYLLGDLHFGVRNNSIEQFEIQRDFIVNWFLDQLEADGFDPELDVLFQAGDWNHVRESTNIRISNLSLAIFDRLTSFFKRGIHIILGNHDVYYKDRNDLHSLKDVDLIYDNVKIYEKPEILTINNKHKMLMLPWEHDNSVLSDIVKQHTGKVDYILCHADIKDFKLNRFQKLEHGLSQSDLRSFKKIYSGHIHIRQSKNNMVYLGTPFHLDRGDAGNTKGFYKLNFEGDEIVETFFENTHSPEYIKHQADDILNMSIDEITKLFKNNYVDVLIDSELSKHFPITSFIDALEQCGHRSMEFIPYTSNSTDITDDIEIDSSYEYNIFEILDIYLKAREVPARLLPKAVEKFTDIHNLIKNNKNYHA